MKDKITPRHLYVPMLIQRFSQDFTDIQKGLPLAVHEDLIVHLIKLTKAIETYTQEASESTLTDFKADNTAFLKRHGNLLNDYHNKGFLKYFWVDTVLVEKGIIANEVFNTLSAEEQALSKTEISIFCKTCLNVLTIELDYLYVRQNVVSANLSEGNELKYSGEPDKDITLIRQLLTIYYFLKWEIGLERYNHQQTDVVRLLHLLTGTKFTTVQNSTIYKKYLKLPNCKSDLRQIADLNFIKPYFQGLGMIKSLSEIDKDIQQTVNQLSLSDKAKYKKEHS